MKRASAFIAVILCCLIMSATVFAEDIYIIEDGEDEFVPVETTTAAETTTASPTDNGGINLDTDSLSGYLGSIADKFGESLGSIMDGFDDFNFDFDFGNSMENTTSSGLSGIQAGQYPNANQSGSMTTYPDGQNNQDGQQATDGDETTAPVAQEEIITVIVNGNANNDSWGLSGSTLTLIVFVAAVVILVLVVIIVLVAMTRRSEYNAAVKQKSTLPTVERPSTLAQFIEDDTPKDGKDYSDIAYWNK